MTTNQNFLGIAGKTTMLNRVQMLSRIKNEIELVKKFMDTVLMSETLDKKTVQHYLGLSIDKIHSLKSIESQQQMGNKNNV